MPETLKLLNRLTLWNFSSMTIEVYIRLIEIQRGTTEVQKAQLNSRSSTKDQIEKIEQHIDSLVLKKKHDQSSRSVGRNSNRPQLKL